MSPKVAEITFSQEEPTREAEQLLQVLIDTRDKLREAKQWQLADEIRAKLAVLDITLEDTPQGTVWKSKR